ncbi:unnamed protein product [Echinostoma caproni]|uniref:Uncharacterized protein n=1 Tax=Echinostoma caproni TaxID=27848 RepID=A0A183ASZ6_9TREM|nr:unnamed protein product [Echinostoma caproni]
MPHPSGIRKIWVHRTLNDPGDIGKFHCLSVSLASDISPTVVNAATISTEEEVDEITLTNRSTYGKQVFVPAPIRAAFETSNRRARNTSPSSPQLTLNKKLRDSSPVVDSEAVSTDILRGYKQPVFEVTPSHDLIEQSYLTSAIVSSSAYFPPKSPVFNQDDVKNALQSALDTDQEPPSCIRSPVFHRNPFSSSLQSSSWRTPTPTKSDLSNCEDLIGEPSTSPILDGIPAACMLERRYSQPGSFGFASYALKSQSYVGFGS